MAQRLYLIKDYDTALVAMPKWPITGLNQPPVWKNRQHTARTYCPNIYIYIYCPSTTYFFWMENIRRHRITIMWHWTVCADVFSKPYWQVNRKRAHVTFPFPSPNTVSWPQRFIIRQSTIWYAGSLVRWDKWLVDQVSDNIFSWLP